MACAPSTLRTLITGVLGIAFLTVGAGSVAWLDSGADRQWLIRPATLPGLQPLDTRADLVLDVLKVVLVLASALLVVARGRTSVRAGVEVAVVMLMANASVQALKHWPVQPFVVGADVEPLSGHAALVGAVALTSLATVRSARTALASLGALAAVGITCAAAVALGQHSPLQVAVPLLISLGWALALILLRAPLRLEPRWGPCASGAGMAALGLGFVALSLCASSRADGAIGLGTTGAALVPLVAFLAGTALLVVGATAAGASLVADHAPVRADGPVPGDVDSARVEAEPQ